MPLKTQQKIILVMKTFLKFNQRLISLSVLKGQTSADHRNALTRANTNINTYTNMLLTIFMIINVPIIRNCLRNQKSAQTTKWANNATGISLVNCTNFQLYQQKNILNALLKLDFVILTSIMIMTVVVIRITAMECLAVTVMFLIINKKN